MARLHQPIVAALAALALGGCSGMLDRLAAVGTTPQLSPVENPELKPDYRPVTMPMPRPPVEIRNANSLWRQGARAFFKDQRAGRVGDILTVLIEIKDKANFQNATTRTRDNAENASASALLGFEQKAKDLLPKGFDPTKLVDLASKSQANGDAKIDRKETIDLKVAAIVTQVLPNGNLVIRGSQEVRVNHEVRNLMVAGVVRREDVSSENTVQHDQIAEARIIYGGRGTLSDVQQPRYGQQVFDIIYPF